MADRRLHGVPAPRVYRARGSPLILAPPRLPSTSPHAVAEMAFR